jgi:hypothetical protein
MGITIGNGMGGIAPFGGAIDEVKVWRLYPSGLAQEFFCRPLSPEAAKCWAEIFKRLQAWGLAQPNQLATIGQLIERLQRTFVGALFNFPAAAQDELRQLLNEYERLWCSGDIGGAKMRDVFERILALLRKHGLDLSADPLLVELQSALARIPIDPKLFDCDTALGAFIQLLKDVARSGGAAA